MKMTLTFFIHLEEFRDLSVPEWNFRKILEFKLSSLLRQQHIYWKQRGSIKWVTLGDARIKFFHANSSIKMRRSLITALEDSDGNLVTRHNAKAELIWNSFKERLGITSFQGMCFNLSSLIQADNDLSSLVVPFAKEEIDSVVKHLPSDKSPGPDGFNTNFFKRCWPIIYQDFYNLCVAFHNDSVCLQSLNGSHITLIPKHDNAIKVSDFRPISLLNTSVKILTKLLANRPQSIMPRLIHKNQYGFIKARTIQDCLAWSLEYLHMCHQTRREIIILMLDFEKAFDKVEHELMLQIMQQKGFPQR